MSLDSPGLKTGSPINDLDDFPDATPREERRRKTRGWVSVGILVVLLSLAYADRSALAVGATEIRTDFHLSDITYGAISSVFAWPYAVSLLVMGGFVDRYGSRKLLTFGTILFSLSQLAMGAVTGIWQFFVLRILLGVGESPGFTSAARATKTWFKDKEQGGPTGVWNSTSALGPALAPLLFTPLMLIFGWRGMFVTLGIIGLVISGVWFFYYRERNSVVKVKGAAKETTTVVIKTGHTLNFTEWGKIFRHRSPRFLAIGAFLGGYMGFTLITWLPQYFEVSRNVSVAETGVLASLPFFAGFIGALVGGRFPDFLMNRRQGLSRILACKIGLAGGALLSAILVVPAILSPNLAVSVIFLGLSQFFGTFSSSNAWNTIQAVSPTSRVGSVGGIWDFGGFLGSGVGPVVTGILLTASGGFILPLLVGALGVLGSSAAYWFGVKERVPDPEIPDGAELAGVTTGVA
jgi:sugar phosphate permease